MICSHCKHDIKYHYENSQDIGIENTSVIFPCDYQTGSDKICGCQTWLETTHYSTDKPGVDQIPPEILLLLGQVYTFGAKKYNRDNWKKGTNWYEFYGSLLRHIFLFWSGENNDKESGLPHLAHVIWNAVTLLYYLRNNIGIDTREIPQ